MKNRVITGAVALLVVVALVGLALVAGSGSDEPAKLPVLGVGGGAEASMAADDAAGSMRWGGAVEYRTSGDLPELAGEEHAWTLDPAEADLDRFAALARLLGVKGEVTRTDYGWTVADEEDRLDIQRVAGLPWNRYQAFAEDTVTSDEGIARESEAPAIESGGGSSGSSGSSSASGTVTASPTPESGSSTVIVEPCPAPCPPNAECDPPRSGEEPANDCVAPEEPKRPENLPTREEAERIGRQLLADLGVDLDHATVRVEDGFTVWAVNADPEVGGLPVVGMTTSVGIGPDGVLTFANGWLGEASRGDAYPLIGTTAAIERLKEEQVRILGAPEPMIAEAPDSGAPDYTCDPAADCVDPTEPPEPIVVTITGVRLGLQLFSHFELDGPAYLVPTYLFATDDGSEMPVIAVPDRYLGQAPEPDHDDPGTGVEPGDEPPAPPSSGSGTCTGQASSDGAEVQVCGPDVVKAGETAVYQLTAKGRIRDDCGSPVPDWGDGSEVAVCAIGCESLPAEPRSVERTFEHVYSKPGTYTVTFTLAGCGAENEGASSISLEVRVEG